jgi:hypothetical protein
MLWLDNIEPCSGCIYNAIFPMAQQFLVGQDLLIIEASRLHSDTLHS